MPHDDPAVGKKITAGWGQGLDNRGAYTPELNAATNPNLGADGEAVGVWHRNGHLITAYARFLFSGVGLDPGQGNFSIEPPFPPDLSFHDDATTAGAGNHLGSGFIRDDSTPANSVIVATYIRLASGFVGMRFVGGGINNVSDNNPFIWAEGDRISVFFTYVADSASLP